MSSDREIVLRFARLAWGAAAGAEATAEDAEIDLPEEKLGHCKHMQVRVIAAQRIVVCRTCDEDLDPFWTLWQYAIKERLFRHCSKEEQDKHASAQKELSALKREISELEKKRDQLRAQLRSYGGR